LIVEHFGKLTNNLTEKNKYPTRKGKMNIEEQAEQNRLSIITSKLTFQLVSIWLSPSFIFD
tara:strand:+ start:1398 stop:1580 length:183 start_codon:yes stop_codon:yes gene_type:complete